MHDALQQQEMEDDIIMKDNSLQKTKKLCVGNAVRSVCHGGCQISPPEPMQIVYWTLYVATTPWA
jgi:hypothetical protein